MKSVVFCPLVENFKRWAIFLLPLCLCGCFDSHAAKSQQARGKGIATITRFFSITPSSSEGGAANAATPEEFLGSIPRGLSKDRDFAQNEAELNIALPIFFSDIGSTADNPFRSSGVSASSSSAGRGRSPDSVSPIAASILQSTSFSELFSSIFAKNRPEAVGFQQNIDEDLPNPFTEARLKREASAAESETSETKPESAVKSPPTAQDNPKPPSTDSAPVAAGAGVPLQDQFLLIGDFNGSGRLSAISARRSGNTAFVSDDGERGFNLYVNFAALDQQSAFYVDDINADGNADLLVTSSPSLSGSVLLGDGNGKYHLIDRFLTGYEPVIPTGGPLRSGMREILAVNSRTGELKTFVFSDRYRLAQTVTLPFVPNYLLHLITPDSSREFVRVAQTSGAETMMSWGDDDRLQPIPETLGADPTALITPFKDSSVQVYQVGSYASVVLASQGNSFNVANLRVMPQTFLVFGDIFRQGFIDVAVATISYFTPKKQ